MCIRDSADIEGGSTTLADYFADRYDEIFSFASRGTFTPKFDLDSTAKTLSLIHI